jgi:hypothetical protein
MPVVVDALAKVGVDLLSPAYFEKHFQKAE